MSEDHEVVLRMQGITKRFPGVIANDHVNFEVKSGEVHGLLGENGAGKTTLMNILYGLHQPDSGDIFLNEERVEITSSRVALDHGIGMVHQHFMLVENLTALENVMLGLEMERSLFLDIDRVYSRFQQLTEQYHLPIDPSTPVWQMPVGSQQWLEIVKLLFRDARIIILDEPTAVLAPSQIDQLFKTIRRLAKEGKSIIFISHKLREMKEISDRVTILRDGCVVETVETSQAEPGDLSRMMVGRSISIGRRRRPQMNLEREVLIIRDLNCDDDRGVPALNNFDLIVHAGEIVGVAGVDGNGQRELAENISGLRAPKSGYIEINGHPVRSVVRETSLLAYIPEDRRKVGLVVDLSVGVNLSLKAFRKPPYSISSFLQWKEIHKAAKNMIQRYNIKTPGSNVPVSYLSGGNQQKIVVAREIEPRPPFILASQPTRGLDLGAVDLVHKTLLEERNRGAGVLFISTELAEVMTLSDRIIVLFEGNVMGDMEGETADVETIGELMMGHRVAQPQAVPGNKT